MRKAMNKIDVGQTISILANIGVIAGIAFLAIEIRDSNTQARIATTQETIAQNAGWWELIAADPGLSDIYFRGMLDFESLAAGEQHRFSSLMHSFLLKMSGNLSARNVGLVGLNPDFETRALEGVLLRMLDQPGFRQWWAGADRRGLPRQIVGLTEELEALRRRGQE